MDSFQAKKTLSVAGKQYRYWDIAAVDGSNKLPYSLKILLENLLRNEDGANITAEQIASLGRWNPNDQPHQEIQFTPARVIMQDFTGVPCVVDLATMREAVANLGADPSVINPQSPAEMVIDHSVIIEHFGTPRAFDLNQDIEYERNRERYQFLRWGQGTFDNFKVVPPGTGIVHQVNIEHLARVVFATASEEGEPVLYPDTCVGTDSHTTMVNGLGVLGWGVGGIEAEAAMLGQPVSMLVPRVVGFKLHGELPEGTTATDLVLTITEMLRAHRVVGKFVEFYGSGVSAVPLANRATIGNMSPEYGSTCAIFPIDDVTLDYLRLTGRSEEHIETIRQYALAQGLWHNPEREAHYSETLELDLATVVPSIAGPKRPQDRIVLSRAKDGFTSDLPTYTDTPNTTVEVELTDGTTFELGNGAVAVASITSCTNTSNPSVMVGAGLVAKKAVERGLSVKPWVKTTLAPGSQVVTDYFANAGLTPYLDQLGFNLAGYGCATCIGNTGPLIPQVSQAVNEHNLAVTAVLSGNRNFEGRISPDVKMNYLASPMLVIIYALAGTMDIDLTSEPIGIDKDGVEVYMRDLWPSEAEIAEAVSASINRQMYLDRYADVFTGDQRWNGLKVPDGKIFAWDAQSTYIRKAPYFDNMSADPEPVSDIVDARVLLKLGDSVTTDHISPAGAIKIDSPAGQYLRDHGVEAKDFNSYGSRRGNHEVMIRGTFANIRLRNGLAEGREGGYTKDFTHRDHPVTTVYEAAMNYRDHGIALVVLAGKEYGSGSSRDWAAKGTALLGVKVVIAESYERIHRSNLIGMGVLPLEFLDGQSADSLGLRGDEVFSIRGIDQINTGVTPRTVTVTAKSLSGTVVEFEATVRIDTPGERDYYLNGGILQFVLRQLATARS